MQALGCDDFWGHLGTAQGRVRGPSTSQQLGNVSIDPTKHSGHGGGKTFAEEQGSLTIGMNSLGCIFLTLTSVCLSDCPMLLKPFELALPLGTGAISLKGNHSFDTLLEVTDESGG